MARAGNPDSIEKDKDKVRDYVKEKLYERVIEYFFKAMVGGAAWKKRFEEDVRFGTNILEAYTQATLESNYFAWVYEYVKENPGSTLKTEYDIAGDDNATDYDC
jgi:hypothetical protein